MATWSNTAEGGTNGATISVGNSGGASGDPFRLVAVTGSASITYSSSAAFAGNRGYRFRAPSGGVAQASPYDFGATSYARVRFYLRFTATPNTATQLVQVANGASQACGYVYVLADGRLALYNATPTQIAVTTNGLAANTWYRIEAVFDPATTTTGRAMLGYALGDGRLIETLTKTNVNLGSTASVKFVNLGKLSNVGNWAEWHLDEIVNDDEGTNATFIGAGTLDQFKAGGSSLDLRLGTATPSAVYAGSTPIWP